MPSRLENDVSGLDEGLMYESLSQTSYAVKTDRLPGGHDSEALSNDRDMSGFTPSPNSPVPNSPSWAKVSLPTHVPSHKSTASPQPCPQPCPQPRPQPCRVTNALLLHQQALDPREAPPKHGTVKSSIFNLVSTIVGGGVLSLPYAFRQTGFALGAVILGLVAIMSAYSAHLLVACGRRCNAWVTNPTAL